MTFNLYRIACTDDYQQSSESLGQFLEQEIDEAEIDKVLDSSVIMEYEGNRIVMDAGGIDYEHASVDTGLERSEAWREFTVYPQIIENNTDYNDLISLMEEKIDEKLPPVFRIQIEKSFQMPETLKRNISRKKSRIRI